MLRPRIRMLPPMWQRRKVHTEQEWTDIKGDVTIQYLHSYETQAHAKSVSLMGLLLQPICFRTNYAVFA